MKSTETDRNKQGVAGSIHVWRQAWIRTFPEVSGPPDPDSAHRFPPAGIVRAGASSPAAGRGGPVQSSAGRWAAGAVRSSNMHWSRRRTFAVTTVPFMIAVTAALSRAGTTTRKPLSCSGRAVHPPSGLHDDPLRTAVPGRRPCGSHPCRRWRYRPALQYLLFLTARSSRGTPAAGHASSGRP